MQNDRLNTKEAAKLAGIGVSTLNRKVSEKKFPQPIKIDRKNYYSKEEVQKWKKGNWFYMVVPDKLEQPVDAMLEDFVLYHQSEEEMNWLDRRPRLKAWWGKYHISYVLICVAVLVMLALGF